MSTHAISDQGATNNTYCVVKSDTEDSQHQTDCDQNELEANGIESLRLLVVGEVYLDGRLLILSDRHRKLAFVQVNGVEEGGEKRKERQEGGKSKVEYPREAQIYQEPGRSKLSSVR